MAAAGASLSFGEPARAWRRGEARLWMRNAELREPAEKDLRILYQRDSAGIVAEKRKMSGDAAQQRRAVLKSRAIDEAKRRGGYSRVEFGKRRIEALPTESAADLSRHFDGS